MNHLWRPLLSALLTATALLFAAACSAPSGVPDVPAEQDLTGWSAEYGIEAQKLFSKARLLWDRDENCSDPELATEYLDAVISLQPDYAGAYMRRALAASELKDWEAAFADSSRGIRLRPEAEHYAALALIFMRQGNYLGARKDMERALSLRPDQAQARELLHRLELLEKK